MISKNLVDSNSISCAKLRNIIHEFFHYAVRKTKNDLLESTPHKKDINDEAWKYDAGMWIEFHIFGTVDIEFCKDVDLAK